MTRILSILCLLASTLAAQPKRILYITLSAAYKHAAIPASIKALQEITAQSGKLEAVQTEDVSMLWLTGQDH